jgi:hypothetical protein
VASEIGVAWRVLGQRLNFTPKTLDAIANSTSGLAADSTHKQVRADARVVKQHSCCVEDPNKEASNTLNIPLTQPTLISSSGHFLKHDIFLAGR